MIGKLNYHHLRYFHAVARDGNLSRAADRLNVAQSALSVQIKQLEDRLGFALFERVSRSLVLTEAGRIALDHADRIFAAGDELVATLAQTAQAAPPLRIGAQSTLSRNFQMQFLRPLVGAGDFVLKSGNTDGLLADLTALKLDVVLTTNVPAANGDVQFAAQLIAEQAVSLHGVPERMGHATLADVLTHESLILPTEPVIRAGIEHLMTALGVSPRIVADVDDMAMVRLLARDGVGVAVAPPVVVADEVARGVLVTAPFDLGIKEPFFAVTAPRKFPHPALADVLTRNL